MEKLTQNTLIPLSLVIAVFGTIGAGIWQVAVMNQKISSNQLAIAEIKASCTSNPSRQEFDDLKDDISEIKTDIKKLIAK